MKKLTSNIIFLCMLLPLTAQSTITKPEVYIGPELNMNNNIQVPMIFGHDETGYFAYTFDYAEGISHYSRGFEHIRSRHLRIQEAFQKKTLLALFHFHDSLYAFTMDEKTKRVILYVETIDKKTLKQNGDIRMLMDIRNMAGWTAYFKFKMSRKEDRLLIYSCQDILSKKIQDLHFEMYGKGMSLEWEADQRIVYRGRTPRESIIKVSDEGDAFVISLKDEQGIRSLWQEIKNRYTLVAITENGQKVNAYTLNLPDLYIRGVQIEPGGEYDLSCVGLYSPTHSRSMVDGVFYFDLDNTTGEYMNRQLFEFEPWFIKDAAAWEKDKDPEEMFDFTPRHLIRRNNSDLFFLAENEFIRDYDTYQNIIAINFGPGGVQKWKRVIVKRQGIDKYTAFNYSSYSVHAPWYADKIHLIFNDHIRNRNWPEEEKIKTFHPEGRANLKVISIGIMGEMSSEIIYCKTKKRMKTPIPVQYYNMLNHQAVIPALRMKRFNYLRISFIK